MAVVVIGVAAGFAEYQHREIFAQSQRTMVLDKLGLVRAQLEGKVNSNLQLIHGLVGVIATEPDMGQVRFSALASYLFNQSSQLINIAAAPDFVVRMVYPLTGNEAALGLDYRRNADQRDAAMQARDTREIVLAGPVHLVQVGRGFLGRYPVYYRDAAGEEQFWGIVSAVIDADRLYVDSGLAAMAGDISIAISGRDGQADNDAVFYGDAAVLESDPVRAEVLLPSGNWIISAIPAEGWGANPPNTAILRVGIALAAALILVPIVLLGRLNEERRRRMIEQRRRESELSRLSRRLELALATSQVGVWEMNIGNGALSWDDRMNELYGYLPDGGQRGYTHWRDRLHPDDLERAERDFNESIRSGSQYFSNYRIMTPEGEMRYIRAIGSVYQDPGNAPRIVGVNWDATPDAKLSEALLRAKTQAEAKNFELETAKARIEHNAMHDPLTGLPNRRYLDDILDMHTKRSARNGGYVSIQHIDLDWFKQINDTLGPRCGHPTSWRGSGATNSSSCASGKNRMPNCGPWPSGSLPPCASRFPIRAMNAGSAFRSGLPGAMFRSRRPSRCWSTPTSPFIAPRSVAGAGPNSSQKNCRPRSSPPSVSPTIFWPGSRTTNSSPSTSRRWMPERSISWAWRRWRAGTTPSRGCWRPTPSWRLPRI